MYEAVTDGIKVLVKPFFLEDQSSPDENHYVWAYQISIENMSVETVQLRNRFWGLPTRLVKSKKYRGQALSASNRSSGQATRSNIRAGRR